MNAKEDRVMKFKFKIYRYAIKLLMVSSLISASLTYAVAQYYSAEEVRELIRKAGRRNSRNRKAWNLALESDADQ